MYGSFSAFSGLPFDPCTNVSSWYQGSVLWLHLLVVTPSQSTSMSDFQNTAPFAPQTAMLAEVSSSDLYLPLEIWLHLEILASSWLALGPAFASWVAVGSDASAAGI